MTDPIKLQAAITRLREWNEGGDIAEGYTPEALDFQLDLRMVLGEVDRALAAGAEAMREVAAKLAASHDPERDAKPLRRDLPQGIRDSIYDERRGEKIAAEIIARAIRSLPVPVNISA